MKTVLCSALALIACVALLAAEPDQKMPKPQYDDKGQLVRPADYREWMFLSAGYGMNYSPAPGSHEMFTNVFVQRWAYDEFVKAGKWPEQSMFVIREPKFHQSERALPDRSDGPGRRGERLGAQSGQVGLLRLRSRRQNGRSYASWKWMLVLPRRSRGRRTHVRAVLSHAEDGRKEVRNLQ